MIAIGAGSSIGTIGRYYLNLNIGYPVGTVVENLLGSLLIGFLTAWFLTFVPKEWMKLGLIVGLCGGFTTMSTFAADVTFLYQTYTFVESALYVLISTLGGISLAFFGYFMGTLVTEKIIRRQSG